MRFMRCVQVSAFAHQRPQVRRLTVHSVAAVNHGARIGNDIIPSRQVDLDEPSQDKPPKLHEKIDENGVFAT